MKINYTRGCICDDLSVDNENFYSLSLQKRKEILHKIIDNCGHDDIDYFFQDILIEMLKAKGEYACSDKACECCGDFVESYTLKINN